MHASHHAEDPAPPRSGLQRLTAPCEYRHVRFSGVGRVVGGSVAAAVSVTCLACDTCGWAAFFLAIAALNLAGGSWYLTIDNGEVRRSENGR